MRLHCSVNVPEDIPYLTSTLKEWSMSRDLATFSWCSGVSEQVQEHSTTKVGKVKHKTTNCKLKTPLLLFGRLLKAAAAAFRRPELQ